MKTNLGHVWRRTEREAGVDVDGRLSTIGEVHRLPKAFEPACGSDFGELAQFLVEDLSLALCKGGDPLLDLLEVLGGDERLEEVEIEAEGVFKGRDGQARQRLDLEVWVWVSGRHLEAKTSDWDVRVVLVARRRKGTRPWCWGMVAAFAHEEVFW